MLISIVAISSAAVWNEIETTVSLIRRYTESVLFHSLLKLFA